MDMDRLFNALEKAQGGPSDAREPRFTSGRRPSGVFPS